MLGHYSDPGMSAAVKLESSSAAVPGYSAAVPAAGYMPAAAGAAGYTAALFRHRSDVESSYHSAAMYSASLHCDPVFGLDNNYYGNMGYGYMSPYYRYVQDPAIIPIGNLQLL